MHSKTLITAIALALPVFALAPRLAARDVVKQPKYHFDTAPEPRWKEPLVYPYELLRDGVKGAATVTLVIDDAGKILSATVDKATRPEFGAATLAMLQRWDFEPAWKDHRPATGRFTFEQEFSRYDKDLVNEGLQNLLVLVQKHPEKIVSSAKLDAPLKPTGARAPIFPLTLHGQTTKGEATVEILIDGDGVVRLPRIVSASDPAFGAAAAQAVFGWQFQPPMKAGQPVITRVRIPFEFVDKPNEPAEKAK